MMPPNINNAMMTNLFHFISLKFSLADEFIYVLIAPERYELCHCNLSPCLKFFVGCFSFFIFHYFFLLVFGI